MTVKNLSYVQIVCVNPLYLITNKINGYIKKSNVNKYLTSAKKLSEEEKNIKREYGRSRYHNMSEEKKQRLKDCQKNYREAKKRLS